ncbi:MAG: PD-(D/E)XK nuclease family transposase [Eubacteriales bacterium]|nr:PD-(D/E)XK nuclease family transposase [Eubacteriales bacterium]
MANKLQERFPTIRTRTEVLYEIQRSAHLNDIFSVWTKAQQEEFLDFCSGARGIKMLYDSFFKEIMNPSTTPERLEEFLSLVLEKKVTIVKVLPNDNTRIADEGTLLVTDIIVKLGDGSIANVEIQRSGYAFPGQRCACYSADMLLRQYKKLRGQKKRKFRYQDIKDVYTIVLYAKSPKEFKKFPEIYCHYFQQTSDTGLQINMLQKYVMIPLDIFRKVRQNRGIRNRLDAWLTFLAEDDPEVILNLLGRYPDFSAIYEQAYAICQNMENVMGFFSEELRILDRNTAQYMIDEMQLEIDQKKAELEQQNAALAQHKNELEQQSAKLEQQNTKLEQQESELAQQKAEIAKRNAEIKQKDAEIAQQRTLLEQQQQSLLQLQERIALLEKRLETQNS